MDYNTDRKTLRVPLNGISEEGKRIAEDLLAGWKLPCLPTNWDWQWKVNGKGEYVGTFPKRVAKYLYRLHATKLTADQLGVLGSKVAEHCERNASYTFDFTDRFDWNAGDFGDRGSCFWGSNSEARAMLENNCAMAVRFYKDGAGYARAWVASTMRGAIVFNGYGLETLQIARILAHNWGAYYKKIYLANNGEDTSTLYINGGAGYIVGSQDSIDGMDSFDFGWEDTGHEHCDNCIAAIEEDYARCVDDGVYCESCYDSLFFYCETCEEDCSVDDYSNVDECSICTGCLEANYTKCAGCNEWVEDDKVFPGPDGCARCANCYPDVVGFCDDCGDDYLHEDMKIGPDDEARCEACHSDKVASCGDCGDDCMREDMETGPDDEARCEACHSDKVAPVTSTCRELVTC